MIKMGGMKMFSGIKFTKRYEPEKIHINLARLKKNGKNYEIVVDPDNAVAFKEGKMNDIREVLSAEHIFENAKKGIFSPKMDLQSTFGTLDEEEIAEFILRKGDLQLSSKYRDEKQAEKKRRVLEIIHRNAINPQNNLPHPIIRLENAFEEAKIRIDDKRTAEDQVQDILKKLKHVLPIRIENKTLQIHLIERYAKKHYKLIHNYGKIIKENWLDDGCYLCLLEIPAGIYLDLVDDLSRKTHGGVEIKVMSSKDLNFQI
ncbi:TPA: ribosome assembly factor SBDS [Candidatus Woesearchaeota archaeon]|nr:ribosome assembly factor SBDS [Candidatus Woesearchaeota archaeon]HIH31542.1 ribosome assembly factor SBDS [Candidatus Woesearchaeota archaeon]HIJ02510.1 ribosome assembly factor SBDS [Candidatus Woesearchaeota archaeon]HIJ13444.1 ribosome assembly factor SBDS [Candidatus Woesearchaeota archaeon]